MCSHVQGVLHLVPADRDLHHPQYRDGHLLLHSYQLPEEGHQQHGHHDEQVDNFTLGQEKECSSELFITLANMSRTHWTVDLIFKSMNSLFNVEMRNHLGNHIKI